MNADRHSKSADENSFPRDFGFNVQSLGWFDRLLGDRKIRKRAAEKARRRAEILKSVQARIDSSQK